MSLADVAANGDVRRKLATGGIQEGIQAAVAVNGDVRWKLATGGSLRAANGDVSRILVGGGTQEAAGWSGCEQGRYIETGPRQDKLGYCLWTWTQKIYMGYYQNVQFKPSQG